MEGRLAQLAEHWFEWIANQMDVGSNPTAMAWNGFVGHISDANQYDLLHDQQIRNRVLSILHSFVGENN